MQIRFADVSELAINAAFFLTVTAVDEIRVATSHDA